MGLKRVTGTKKSVTFHTSRPTNAKDPMLLISADGIAQLNVRCRDLLAVTAVIEKELVDRVITAAEGVQDPDKWTRDDVAAMCRKLGRLPRPSTVMVEPLEGQGSWLLQVATSLGPNVSALGYRRGSSRPYFNALPALKGDSVKVPKGMCLEVPVALVLDNGQLKVEARLMHGKERPVKT